MPNTKQSTAVPEQPEDKLLPVDLSDDGWGCVFERLPIREQVKLRRVSKRMRDIVDGNRSSYGRMLTRDCLLEGCDENQAAQVRFRNTWLDRFQFKLNSDQLNFFSAVIDGNIATVERLLKQHPGYARLKDQKGNLALHYAAACGRVEIYQLLDKIGNFSGGNLNDAYRRVLKKSLRTNKAEETPRDWVIRYGQLEKFKNYFEIPKNTNNLISLQIAAARYGKVELLFDGGLLSDLTTIEKDEPNKLKLLHMAALYGHREVVKRFTQNPTFNKAMLQEPNVLSVFHAAVRSGNVGLVDDLLQIDLDLIDTMSDRSTLDYAVLGGKLAMVIKIYQLQKQRQPLEPASYHLVDYAAQYGYLNILQYLLPILKDYHGEALVTAIQKFGAHKRGNVDNETLQRYQDCVVLLVNHHVNKAKNDRSPHIKILDRALGVAFDKNADELLPILSKAGAKPRDLVVHYKNMDEAAKAQLSDVRRDLVNQYQAYAEQAELGFKGIALLVLVILLYIGVIFAIGAAIGAAGFLLINLVPMSLILQYTALGVGAALGILVEMTVMVCATKPFFEWLTDKLLENPLDKQTRTFSLVENVVPISGPEQASAYYWVPPQAAAMPEATAKAVLNVKAMDANSVGEQLEEERVPERRALTQ